MTYKLYPNVCKWCSNQVYTYNKMTTAGVVVAVVLFFLTCVGVIIPIIFMRESYVACPVHGRQ